MGQVGLPGKAWPRSVSLELVSLVTRAIDKLPKPQCSFPPIVQNGKPRPKVEQ